MNTMMQGLVGAGIALVVFAAGIGVGRVSMGNAEGSKADAVEPKIQVMFPSRVNLDVSGIGSDRAACLEWVSRNFKEPNVGQFAMICGAGTR